MTRIPVEVAGLALTSISSFSSKGVSIFSGSGSIALITFIFKEYVFERGYLF